MWLEATTVAGARGFIGSQTGVEHATRPPPQGNGATLLPGI
jgi:hypothetical protein